MRLALEEPLRVMDSSRCRCSAVKRTAHLRSPSMANLRKENNLFIGFVRSNASLKIGPGTSVEGWITDLHEAEKPGHELASFMIMALGEDHTRGAEAGWFTPQACVASNDIGIGKIVDAASKSKYWPEMAIFMIEDDAQNGPDHVDAHRTVGFVISPYVKRKFVDSTPYTTTSMLRTM